MNRLNFCMIKLFVLSLLLIIIPWLVFTIVIWVNTVAISNPKVNIWDDEPFYKNKVISLECMAIVNDSVEMSISSTLELIWKLKFREAYDHILEYHNKIGKHQASDICKSIIKVHRLEMGIESLYPYFYIALYSLIMWKFICFSIVIIGLKLLFMTSTLRKEK